MNLDPKMICVRIRAVQIAAPTAEFFTISLFIAAMLTAACGDVPADHAASTSAADTAGFAHVDLQGHRGARGLLPENSIPSFEKALDLGVRTIELDVVVTADSVVIVSHEPWFSHVICSTPDGEPVLEADERSYNIFQMTYEETTEFDCGSRGNRLFETQQPLAVRKPRLDSTIVALDQHAADSGRSAPRYNIEIKSQPAFDGSFAPAPPAFTRLVHGVIDEHGIAERTTVQSFDARPLRSLREIDSSLTLALLVSNELGVAANVEQLGFTPPVYSPHYGLVDASTVDSVHDAGMKIIPWTVNETDEMRRLLNFGVDGIITDYPDRAAPLLQSGIAEYGSESRTP